MSRPIFQLPPYVVRQVMLASELKDQITWGLKATGIPDAWKLTRGATKDGKRVVVGVIDTGIDEVHYRRGDLSNVAEVMDATGYGPFTLPNDDHGSHCMSILMAAANDMGIVGVAPDAEGVSICGLKNGQGQSDWLERAIDMGRDRGCNVLSASWGSDYPDPGIAAAIERFVAGGGFFIAAAGNNGKRNGVEYPGRYNGGQGRPNLDTIGVAATDRNGQRAPFSAMGPEVDCGAPGVGITGCWHAGSYAVLDGTSMATPFVAGVVCLMLAHHWNLGNRAKDSLKTMNDLREHLKRQSLKRNDEIGWGIVGGDEIQEEPAENPVPPKPEPQEPGKVTVIDLGILKIYAPARAGDDFSIKV